MKKILGFLLLFSLLLAISSCTKTKEEDSFVPDSAPTLLPESENQPNI